MRLGLITNIISPYRIPLFNHLARINGLDFKVIFLAENEKHRKWKVYYEDIVFDYSILKNFCVFVQSKEMPIYLNWGLWRELRRFQPDVLCILGYHYLVALESLMYAKCRNIPITLWAGSHLSSGFVKNSFAELYRKAVIPKFSSYVTYGTAAMDQIIHYGAKSEKIVVGCNTVDIEWFTRKLSETKVEAMRLRGRQYTLKNILYVGDFIERKGVINLIKAFEQLRRNEYGLILVGEGREKDRYLRYVRDHHVKNVFFEGFKQREELVKYYNVADVFVLPSLNEVWGLVVNEAMACGLPVISSKLAGATRDLVEDGINGYSFDPRNIEDLAEKLSGIMSNDEMKQRMGSNSLRIIKDKTPQRYAERILEAVRCGLQNHG